MAKFKKQIYLGCGPSGKQIRKWIYGDTKAELERNILNARIEAGKVVNPIGMTFGEFSERWFEIYKAHRSGQTRWKICKSLYWGSLRRSTSQKAS